MNSGVEIEQNQISKALEFGRIVYQAELDYNEKYAGFANRSEQVVLFQKSPKNDPSATHIFSN